MIVLLQMKATEYYHFVRFLYVGHTVNHWVDFYILVEVKNKVRNAQHEKRSTGWDPFQMDSSLKNTELYIYQTYPTR